MKLYLLTIYDHTQFYIVGVFSSQEEVDKQLQEMKIEKNDIKYETVKLTTEEHDADRTKECLLTAAGKKVEVYDEEGKLKVGFFPSNVFDLFEGNGNEYSRFNTAVYVVDLDNNNGLTIPYGRKVPQELGELKNFKVSEFHQDEIEKDRNSVSLVYRDCIYIYFSFVGFKQLLQDLKDGINKKGTRGVWSSWNSYDDQYSLRFGSYTTEHKDISFGQADLHINTDMEDIKNFYDNLICEIEKTEFKHLLPTKD